jgi:hypothetical protein
VNAGHRDRPGSTSPAGTAGSRGYVEIPGGRLYCQTQGCGPALVLLGGGPANADTPGPLASHLADDYTVITYRPGHDVLRLAG